ncbi:hypothetical protein MLD38_034015 [Melastoma candidum]|uniref:Uncharacterized protein n=1 Tax=Melastoma candidum TaxID=119954 RepID=A0ACB9MAG4_9MYRT|nr:hypothetical protein MLD38_034015 [Melastoma candidum]
MPQKKRLRSLHVCSCEAFGAAPARFDASKLKVDVKEREMNPYSSIIPRTYILSHCDFTANLTLTISNVISLDQLRGWYCKDDVVWGVEDLAAEFRYQIFSKDMPLVLKAIPHGDASLFSDDPELLNSVVWVYFHSSSPKYNCRECWGPLKDAARENTETNFKVM